MAAVPPSHRSGVRSRSTLHSFGCEFLDRASTGLPKCCSLCTVNSSGVGAPQASTCCPALQDPARWTSHGKRFLNGHVTWQVLHQVAAWEREHNLVIVCGWLQLIEIQKLGLELLDAPARVRGHFAQGVAPHAVAHDLKAAA
eukprot:UN0721